MLISPTHKILLAEDNLLISNQIQVLLKKAGVKNITQTNSAAAMMHLPEGEKPDLFLMNIQLADRKVDIDFIKKIRRKRAVPLVILTGYARKMLAKEMLDLSEVYFLQKPFLPFQLTNVLQNALNPHR